MKRRVGDLIELADRGEFDIIVHGCNCFHTMGAGIAYALQQKWPEVARVDKELTNYGDGTKLGTITVADVKPGLRVVNAYTQYSYGAAIMNVDYKAIESAFIEIERWFGREEIRFGIPKIGAGLGGGDWNKISQVIADIMAGENITVVTLK